MTDQKPDTTDSDEEPLPEDLPDDVPVGDPEKEDE